MVCRVRRVNSLYRPMPAGGYELQLSYDNQLYTSAFRVADYVKPHFEINLLMAKNQFHTKEPVTGKIQLLYPDGKPVAGAHIDLSLRSQQLTMVDAQLNYGGQFPVSLTTESLTTDAEGFAELNLPASENPAVMCSLYLPATAPPSALKPAKKF